MLKIGIHKLGFESYSDLKTHDLNGMFMEIKLIFKAFIDQGYYVEYVNTKQTLLNLENYYDVMFVFNGYEDMTSNLINLRKYAKELNYILTDTRFYNLIQEDKDKHEYYDDLIDNYFVQGPKKMFNKPTFNSYIQKLPIYEHVGQNKKEAKRTEKVIFGGSVRGRRDKIENYITDQFGNSKLLVDSYLKDEELNYDRRLPINEYKDMLRKYKFGIVLTDHEDIKLGNVTWRYYENIANDVLTFVDEESNGDSLILDKRNFVERFMLVNSYDEVARKMNIIKENKELEKSIYKMQDSNVLFSDAVGKTFTKALLESRDENVRK